MVSAWFLSDEWFAVLVYMVFEQEFGSATDVDVRVEALKTSGR